jgi:hypothetical protein
MSQHDHTVEQTRMFLENMVGFALNARDAGLQVTAGQVVGSTIDKIVEIAEQHFPLAKVMDCSDFVMHAEGPGASQSMPWLSALTWMTSTAETNIRKLAAAYFDMRGANGKAIARKMDPRLTGIAPGSLWVGIKLDNVETAVMGLDHQELSLSDELQLLPGLVRFINDEGMSPGIDEVSPDPAMRDISLAALLRFAPTGRRGIHTLEIGSSSQPLKSLGQRERVVLREALEKPSMRESKHGEFVGEIREADLDKTRLHLRSVSGIGTLRLVVPELDAKTARVLLGTRVKVVGSYQVNRDGKPRLLFVERFEVAPPEAQQPLL